MFVGDSVLRKSATWICNLGRDIRSDGDLPPILLLSMTMHVVYPRERPHTVCEYRSVNGILFMIFSEPSLAWGIYLFNYNIALRMSTASIMQREFCPVL